MYGAERNGGPLKEIQRAIESLDARGGQELQADDYGRGYSQAVRDALDILQGRAGEPLVAVPCGRLAGISEDLQGALDTARAILELEARDRCPCCGAVGRAAADPGAYDDGRLLHDSECFFAIAPGMLAELRRLAGPHRS